MSEESVQIITTISEIMFILIRCDCGEQLTLKRGSMESVLSGTFCQKCDGQYWIRWTEGVVKREVPARKEIVE